MSILHQNEEVLSEEEARAMRSDLLMMHLLELECHTYFNDDWRAFYSHIVSRTQKPLRICNVSLRSDAFEPYIRMRLVLMKLVPELAVIMAVPKLGPQQQAGVMAICHESHGGSLKRMMQAYQRDKKSDMYRILENCLRNRQQLLDVLRAEGFSFL